MRRGPAPVRPVRPVRPSDPDVPGTRGRPGSPDGAGRPRAHDLAGLERSLRDPPGFLAEHVGLVDWIRRPVAGDDRHPTAAWSAGARVNVCFNALDRHVVRGAGERDGLVWHPPPGSTSRPRTWSVAALLGDVGACAGVLRGLGVGVGSPVLLLLPLLPEAVVAALATARLGAVVVATAPGQEAATLAALLDAHRPPVVVTLAGAPLAGLDVAQGQTGHVPDAVVVVGARAQGGDASPARALREGAEVDWDLMMRAGRTDPAEVADVPADATVAVHADPGGGEALVQRQGALAVAASWALPAVYGLAAGEVWWAVPDPVADLAGPGQGADDDWTAAMTGLLWAPVMAGATTVLAPSPGPVRDRVEHVHRVCAEHGVSGLMLGVALLHALTAAGRPLPVCVRTVAVRGLGAGEAQRVAEVLGVEVAPDRATDLATSLHGRPPVGDAHLFGLGAGAPSAAPRAAGTR